MLFRERAKSAYFRSASSDRDNKWIFVLGLGTRFLLALLLVSSQWPKISLKSMRKIYRCMNYIYKSLLQFCLWCEIPLKLLKVYIINVQDCSRAWVKQLRTTIFDEVGIFGFLTTLCLRVTKHLYSKVVTSSGGPVSVWNEWRNSVQSRKFQSLKTWSSLVSLERTLKMEQQI